MVYVAGSGPSPTATMTDANGTAGAVNVPSTTATMATIEARLASTHELVARAEIPIAADVLTDVSLVPLPRQSP